MHPKLIRAQIALYAGERAEVTHLLQALPDTEKHTPAALWLHAETQTDREAQLQYLRHLIDTAPPDDPFAKLAQTTLDLEHDHQTRLDAIRNQPTLQFFGVTWWKIALPALLLIVGMFIISALRPAADHVAITPTAPPVATIFNPPDQSRMINGDDHTARYPLGILQIIGYETASQRVIDRETGTPIQPISGAQFFALHVKFECRGGVCNAPPEANITLEFANAPAISPRADVAIVYQPTLAPVALGRETSGWLVFEIPLIGEVTQLRVAPRSNADFAPQFIPLALP